MCRKCSRLSSKNSKSATNHHGCLKFILTDIPNCPDGIESFSSPFSISEYQTVSKFKQAVSNQICLKKIHDIFKKCRSHRRSIWSEIQKSTVPKRFLAANFQYRISFFPFPSQIQASSKPQFTLNVLKFFVEIFKTCLSYIFSIFDFHFSKTFSLKP